MRMYTIWCLNGAQWAIPNEHLRIWNLILNSVPDFNSSLFHLWCVGCDSVEDVDEHKEEGDEERHPTRDHVHRDEEADPRHNYKQAWTLTVRFNHRLPSIWRCLYLHIEGIHVPYILCGDSVEHFSLAWSVRDDLRHIYKQAWAFKIHKNEPYKVMQNKSLPLR